MIVLAFDQPHATLICEGEQTVVTYPREWVSVRTGKQHLPLSSLVGQTVAIAATGTVIESTDERVSTSHCGFTGGAIVGSARVRAVVPVYGITDGFNDGWKQWTWPNFQVNQDRTLLALVSGYEQMPAPLYDDQLPFADFTPGRTALILTDAAPCEERCPACWDAMPLQTGEPCPSCVPAARGSIPYTPTGPISEVTL